MQYLLQIDTSTDSGAVALSSDGHILASQVNDEARNHASTINQMINTLLADAGITLQDLAAIVVCAGPGSYTGLRIGLATAKGLCYALDKPLMMDNKLTLLANQAAKKYGHEYNQYTTALVARAKEYFVATYDNELNCTLEPQHVMEEQMEQLISQAGKTHITTNAPETVFTTKNNNKCEIENDVKIDLEMWAKYAMERLESDKIENLATSEPFYLKQVYTHN